MWQFNAQTEIYNLTSHASLPLLSLRNTSAPSSLLKSYPLVNDSHRLSLCTVFHHFLPRGSHAFARFLLIPHSLRNGWTLELRLETAAAVTAAGMRVSGQKLAARFD